MGAKKAGFRQGGMAAIFLTFLILAGCGSAIKYSYSSRIASQELKNYTWGKASGLYVQDPLLELNVQSLADRYLEESGLARKTPKADVVMWLSYEYDPDSYRLRNLSLNFSRADNHELLWRGTAAGKIRTDATSGDLKKAVEGILNPLSRR